MIAKRTIRVVSELRFSFRVMAVALVIACTVGVARADEASTDTGQDPIGNGVLLPGNLWIAGEMSLEGEVPAHGPAAADIDGVGVLARWEPSPRFALFGELRFQDLATLVEGDGVSTMDATLVLERLYAETVITPELTLRIGKVFTPFGLWNVIHRAPLTWTIDQPAVVDGMFPLNTTGLSLLYRRTWHGWSFDGTAYGPAQDQLSVHRSQGRGWLVGGRFAVGRSFGDAYGTVGVNLAGFRPKDRPASRQPLWSTSSGLDLDVSVAGHQLTGEWTFRTPAGGGRTQHGMYLQDAVSLEPLTPLARDLHGVVRAEYFQPPRGPAAVAGVLGLFWRPWPSLVVRGSYSFVRQPINTLEPGFHLAVSLLF